MEASESARFSAAFLSRRPDPASPCVPLRFGRAPAAAKTRRRQVLGMARPFSLFARRSAKLAWIAPAPPFGLGPPGKRAKPNEAWLEGKRYAAANYGEFARLSSDDSATAKVDLFLIDQRETGAEITAALDRWSGAISPGGIVLVHGIALERDDAPATAWGRWRGGRAAAEFSAGIGLGVARIQSSSRRSLSLRGLGRGYA